MHDRMLHHFAVLLAVCTLLLVVAGASVTSNDAGLSVPDWPLSYGQVMPEMKGGVFYEHGHRVIATAVGFLTIILAVWLWRSENRVWMKRLGLAALAVVIVQGILGGLTVLYLLPKPVSVSHACLAQLFFSTTVAVAVFTSRSWRRGPQLVEDSGWPSVRSLAIAVPVMMLAQVALGAGYRHKAFGLMPHVVGAIVVAVAALLAAVFVLSQYPGHRDLSRSAKALLGVTLVQVLLGIAAYLSRITNSDAVRPEALMVWMTVLHVAGGALTMAASVMLSIQILRNVRPAAEAPATGLTVSS